MSMEIGPAKTSKVAVRIGAVVPQEEYRVAHNILVDVFDANVVIGTGDIRIRVLFESFCRVVREDDEGGRCLFVSTTLVFNFLHPGVIFPSTHPAVWAVLILVEGP